MIQYEHAFTDSSFLYIDYSMVKMQTVGHIPLVIKVDRCRVLTFDNEQSSCYDAGDDASGNTFIDTVIVGTKVDYSQVARTRKYSGRLGKRTYCLHSIDTHCTDDLHNLG